MLFFFLMLAPVLPVAVLGFSADRFTYLPAVGLAYLCGELIGRALSAPPAHRVARDAAVACAVAALAVLLALQARGQAAAWKNSDALWTQAVRQYTEHGVGGRNLALAYFYRARARLGSGRGAEARADLEQAVRLDPGSAEMRNELGIALASGGAHREALEQFTAALEREPGNSAAAYNRGLALLALGSPAAAASDFSQALDADAGNGAALLGRARARALLGERTTALADTELALAQRPGDTEAAAVRDEILADRARTP